MKYPQDILSSDLWICDSCSASLTDAESLFCDKYIASELAESEEQSFGLCLDCFYHAKFDTNLKIMEEKLSRLSPGERWWGPSFEKPQVRTKQNELIKLIVAKYRDKDSKNSPEDNEDDLDFGSYSSENSEEDVPTAPPLTDQVNFWTPQGQITAPKEDEKEGDGVDYQMM